MKLRIHTLGNNNIFKNVAANYLGVNPEIGRNTLCRMLKDKKATIVISNLFEEYRSNTFEKDSTIRRRGIDLGLHHLRILAYWGVKLEFEDTQSIEVDMQILKTSSPPLYDKCFQKSKTKNE